MEQITRFKDIPKFISCGGWACDFGLDYVTKYIEESLRTENSSLPPLQMNPDFQRGHVWTDEQQVAYIEFLLRGGNSGRGMYFNCPSWHDPVEPGAYNEFVCVDGLQRLTAIKRFMHDEIRVFGSKYSDFTDSLRLTNTVRLHVNDLKTKAEVLQWYLEMNAGGTPHSKDEIQRVQHLLDEENSHTK